MSDKISMDARVLATGWFGMGLQTEVTVGGEGSKSVMTARATEAMKELVAGGFVTERPFNRFGRMTYTGSQKISEIKLSRKEVELHGKWKVTEPRK